MERTLKKPVRSNRPRVCGLQIIALLIGLIVLTPALPAWAGAVTQSGIRLVPGTPEPVNPMEAVARAQRANLDAARRAVARALDGASRIRASDPDVVQAKRASLSALVRFNLARHYALTGLRGDSKYTGLVGSIYNAERRVDLVHRDPFTPVEDEVSAASQLMGLRVELSRMEAEVLQQDQPYLDASEELRIAAEHLRRTELSMRLSGWSDGALLSALARLQQESDRLMGMSR